MEIRQDLPFKHCENCPEFILSVNEQVIFGDDHIMTRALFVRCKNGALCQRLEKMINDSDQNAE